MSRLPEVLSQQTRPPAAFREAVFSLGRHRRKAVIGGDVYVGSGAPSVLFITTQTWLQVSLLAARFSSLGCRVAALCPDESPLAFAPEVSQRFRFSPVDAIRSLRQAIQRAQADYLVPTDDLSVWLLHDLAESEPSLTGLIQRSIGSAEHYATLSSRHRLLQVADRLGIRTASSSPIHSTEELLEWCRDDRLPVVLKKDGTWGGQGVQVIRSAADADTALQSLARPHSFSNRAAEWLRNGDGSAFARPHCLRNPELIAQEYIEGVPANSMYACFEGRILGEVQARVAATRGRSGPSIVIELIQDPRIHEAGTCIASALHLSGFFGLDFMLDDATGEPILIECNPRATQLGHLQVAGQPDLAEVMAAQWLGQEAFTPGAPDLSDAIWFYPDGKRLTEGSASFPGFRPDASPDAMAALQQRMRGNAPLRVGLRRALWRSLARIKGSVTADERPKAYYYPRLDRAHLQTRRGKVAEHPPAQAFTGD